MGGQVFEIAARAEGMVKARSPQAQSIWAKTEGKGGGGWQSLPQHLLDVACVAEQVWEQWTADALKESLARMLKLSVPEARQLYLWMAGHHDLGKATVSFVRLVEDAPGGESLVNRIADAGLPLVKSAEEEGRQFFPHALASRAILLKWLQGEGVRPRVARSLAAVADAHHGLPSRPNFRSAANDVIFSYDPQWSAVHRELLEMVADLTEIRQVLPKVKREIPASAVQLLTGLVIMADWIASDVGAFPLEVTGSQVERTRRGMARVELTSPWQAELFSLADIDDYLRHSFQWPKEYEARPVQRSVIAALEATAGPVLLIIEAPTGEGKTEAGLAAAQLLAATRGYQGCIFAAPTMATANGLFDRVVEWARQNVPGGDISSMFLAHSKNKLSASFEKLSLSRIGDKEGDTGQVVANQWMSGRKKGILSNFVVATVDQVLLMALQSRHSMLRHVGLAGKVVIIDEAHAYDTYMSEYLGTALQWLARYGASVILMSATLPTRQKTTLAQAYASQLTTAPIEPVATGYPLITVVSQAGLAEYDVPARPVDLHATVGLVPDSFTRMGEQLVEMLVDGGCVLIVCNTIRRAQQAYQTLVQMFPAKGEVELHHATFMAHERAAKEDRLRAELGREASRANGGRPYRKIVVATQVAEQSLDIDADLLITDIAPMDLIIQRIGRMHRHTRPSEDRPPALRTPQVFIRGIEKIEPTPEFESGTASIYDPAILLRTLLVLQQWVLSQGFQRPDDIAPLVQATYGEELTVPEEWRDDWESAQQESTRQREFSRLRSQAFRFPDPGQADTLDKLFERYFGDVDVHTGEEAGLAQVRDSDPTIEVIPIITTDYGYRPLGYQGESEIPDDALPDHYLGRYLAGATVRLPAKFSRYESVFEETIDKLEKDTPAGWSQNHLLRGQVALRLNADREVVLAGRTLYYSHDLGLLEREKER